MKVLERCVTGLVTRIFGLSICLTLVCGLPGVGESHAADFVATGSMSVARYNQTATLLPGGKVLIVGGSDLIGTSYKSAELYNPATGLFTPAGSMATGRDGHTATLLDNGKVLIAGGYEAGGAGFLKSAELYDPATGLFTPTTGSMGTARRFHTATLLSNSKVLITGGMSNTIIFNSAELYDPDSETFTSTDGNMTAARYGQTSTLLLNNKVLITGGGGIGSYLSSAELYAPVLSHSLTVAISGTGGGRGDEHASGY